MTKHLEIPALAQIRSLRVTWLSPAQPAKLYSTDYRLLNENVGEFFRVITLFNRVEIRWCYDFEYLF